MDKDLLHSYVRNVETRISPKGISYLYINAERLSKLPLGIQHFLIKKGAKKNPYMGFVVEPYSIFFAYEIDESDVSEYLPNDYELLPSSIFENEEKKKCAIIGCFNVHTSVFWGSRFELYVIARNRKNGLLSWVICDYESNTISYDQEKGFLRPTLARCVLTTTYNGSVLCEFESNKSNNKMDVEMDTAHTSCIELNQQLWIEGNLSIDYSGELSNKGNEPFGLIFDPDEMKCAQLINSDSVKIKELNFGFINKSMKPFAVCCFQYAQHYLTTVFQKGHELKNKNDLENRIINIIRNGDA